MSDEYRAKLAATTVDELQLGRGSHIAFLGVSFSALDLVGHAFDPDSHEVQDIVSRLDVAIGRLLDHLDRTVGAGNYVVAFTADHGVGRITEEAGVGGRETNAETSAAIEKALAPLLGPGKYVANAAYTDIYLEKTVLKPNMVIAGKKCAQQASRQEVAERTVKVLKACVPSAVPGIAFLSGGQSDEDATAHLSLMNQLGPLPWKLSFSYGRALQAAPLKAWGGKSENVAAGQRAFAHRAKMNSMATFGKWSEQLEKAA